MPTLNDIDPIKHMVTDKSGTIYPEGYYAI